MQIKNQTFTKNLLICFVFLVGSLLLGIVCKDNLLIGSITLFFGSSQIYFMTKGVWWAEFFGLAENLLTIYVCVKANLFGTVIFTSLIFVPLSIITLANWKKNQSEGVIIINKMSAQTLLTTMCIILAAIAIIASFIAYLPNQNLPILDSVCNIFELSAVILIALRYKEGWLLWICSSTTNLVIWITLYLSGHSQNGLMMIILTAIYLVMYFCGLSAFIKMRNNQEHKKLAL